MTANTAQSLSQYYRTSAYAAFPQEHRSGGSVPIEFIQVDQSAHDIADPAVPQWNLQVAQEADMMFRWDVGDGWTAPARVQAGMVCLSPPDTEVNYECPGPHKLLLVAIQKGELAALLDRSGLDVTTLNAVTGAGIFRDETIRTTALRMWATSVRDDAASTLMIDGLLLTILARLFERAGQFGRAEHGVLEPRVMARLDEVIAAESAGRLTVARLAEIAGLDPFRFSRAFKTTTGTTPHQYVVERRLSRAKDLLCDPRLTIAEIAFDCGFSSQSHMTDVFRQRLGTTPGAYRSTRRD